MNAEASSLRALQLVCRGAELWEEGARPYVFLPRLKVEHAGKVEPVDALLAPRGDGSYATRLYLDKPFANRGQNWRVYSILGRTWHAMSWNGVSAALPWLQILANHLRPLR